MEVLASYLSLYFLTRKEEKRKNRRDDNPHVPSGDIFNQRVHRGALLLLCMSIASAYLPFRQMEVNIRENCSQEEER